MCRGVARAGLEARALPLADGGEGTLDALLGSLPGTRLTATVTGPDGRPVEAEWAALEDGTGIVEMARASGLALVERNDPLTATTFGTGELIAAALDHGCRRDHRRRRRLGNSRWRPRRARRALLVAPRRRGARRLRRDDPLPGRAGAVRPSERRLGGGDRAVGRPPRGARRAIPRHEGRRCSEASWVGRGRRSRRRSRGDRRPPRARVRRRRRRGRLPGCRWPRAQP